jgi:hypothetical protein
MINGILWKLSTGAPWQDLPERYGPWKTAHERLRIWATDETWEQILDQVIVPGGSQPTLTGRGQAQAPVRATM